MDRVHITLKLCKLKHIKNCKQATLSHFYYFLQLKFSLQNECFPNYI